MPSVAGRSARPCSPCQPREDMIIVQFTCELLCAIPVREISVAAPLARPGSSAELFETTASAGGREVARATHLARSQDRRRPGDLPAPCSRRGCRMSRLRRHGPAGQTGTCPRSTAARKASPTFPVAQCHAADGRNVEACLRWVRCDWSAGGPVSRRPSFVEPVPAATHLHHAGAGARNAADVDTQLASRPAVYLSSARMELAGLLRSCHEWV